MGYHYVILGAGRQGVAMAYDLVRNGEAERLVLADFDGDVARRGVARLEPLVTGSKCALQAMVCDVSKPAEVAMAISGADVVVSAAPYRFNVPLTEAAIYAGASFCDLGGNTQIVRHQLERHARAAEAGVSIVPDCGLAPGLANILAAHGIAALDTPQDVRIRCGGLPQERVGPLAYKLVFNFQGLINEYSGYGEFLRDGEPARVPALTEVEEIELPTPLGTCEAAVTSGGTSTCAETYRGRLANYDYKTIRYPGHFTVMRALFELGCFEEYVQLPDGALLEPRPIMQALMETRMAFEDVPDLVVLRCTVRGQHRGQPVTRTYELLDYQDEKTGFSAMERTTAFPAALVAHMQARRMIEPGARPLEIAVPPGGYFDELGRHDIDVTVRET